MLPFHLNVLAPDITKLQCIVWCPNAKTLSTISGELWWFICNLLHSSLLQFSGVHTRHSILGQNG